MTGAMDSHVLIHIFSLFSFLSLFLSPFFFLLLAAAMNTVLGELLLNAVAIHSNINDTYIAINASLIAAIYTAIGTDAAASLVQGAVERFDLEYNKVLGDAENPQEDIEQGVGGKEALNLAMLITHLYNFQVGLFPPFPLD